MVIHWRLTYQSITQSIGAENTCTLDTKNSAQVDIPSKYIEGQEVWLKLDSNTKWVPGKITQVLPYQSYIVQLSDGCIFHQNKHHLTRRLSFIKPRATSEAGETSHSYNIRPRKAVKHVQWLDYPAEAKQGETNFDS